MIKSIKVTNFRNESLNIVLANPEASSGLALISAEGLGPVDTDINITELATQDGAIYNSSRMQSREVRLSFMFTGIDIEAERHLTYKYFPTKKKLTLAITTDTREVYITGYVESNSPNIFSSREGTTITIICPDPKLYSVEEQKTMFAGTEPLFEFPFESGRMLLMNQQIPPIVYLNTIGSLAIMSNRDYKFSFSGVYLSSEDTEYHLFGSTKTDTFIYLVPGHIYYIASKNMSTVGKGYFKWNLCGGVGDDLFIINSVGDDADNERLIVTVPETHSGNAVTWGTITLEALSTSSQEISISGDVILQLIDITEYYGKGNEPENTSDIEEELPLVITTGYHYETELPKPNPYADIPNIEFGDMLSARELSIVYAGDTDVGIIIEAHCIGEVSNLNIIKVEESGDKTMRIDTAKLEALTGSGLVAGDTIYISTITGEKYIRLLRESVTTNILNALDRESTWFNLASGDNIFSYSAEEGQNNIQFSISNKIAYEGI